MKDDGSDTLAMPSTSATTARPFPTPMPYKLKKPRGIIKATHLFFRAKFSGIFNVLPIIFAKNFPILLSQFLAMLIAKEYIPSHEQGLMLFSIGILVGLLVTLPTIFIWYDWVDEIIKLSKQEDLD